MIFGKAFFGSFCGAFIAIVPVAWILFRKVKHIMDATGQQLQTALDQVNAATNSVATNVQAASAFVSGLEDKLSNLTGVSDADLQPIIAEANSVASNLNASAASLQQMAVDPGNAVPVAPPAPPAGTDQSGGTQASS